MNALDDIRAAREAIREIHKILPTVIRQEPTEEIVIEEEHGNFRVKGVRDALD